MLSHIIFLFFLAININVFSSFEPTAYVSGKYTAVGGAAVSNVLGPEAMIFNPSGLISGNGFFLQLSNSFQMRNLKGSYLNDKIVSSERELNFPIAFLISYSKNSKWSLGAGGYNSSNINVQYRELDYTSANGFFEHLKPDLKFSQQINELGVGFAYRLFSEMSIGFAWRLSYFKSQYSLPFLYSAPILTLFSLQLKDFSGFNNVGFRAGIQYKPKLKKWRLGIAYRSGVDFDLLGKASASAIQSSMPATREYDEAQVKLSTRLPDQISLGIHYNYDTKIQFLGDYSYTRYSDLKKIKLDGTINNSDIGDFELKDIILNWKDMHAFRLGASYRTSKLINLSSAYVLTTPTVPKKHARLYFSPPAIKHSVFFGFNRRNFYKKINLDFSMEYTFASSNLSPADQNVGNNDEVLVYGKFDERRFSIHTGLTYKF